MSEQEVICIYKRGPAPNAIECDYALTRSTDAGKTWHDEGVIGNRNKDDRPYSYGYGYPTHLSSGEILLSAYRWDRSVSDADFNIYNPKTFGAVNCQALLFRSHNDGRTWSEPQIIAPAAAFPNVAGEVAMDSQHRILYWNGMFTRLDDGRILVMYWTKDTATKQA